MAALKYADRIAESTITNGVGDIELAGAIDADHSTFGSAFADADEMPVTVFGGGKWMTFRGRYNAGANSITRITLRSSSTGSNISLSGTMTVLCGWGAADGSAMIRTDEVQALSSAQKLQALKNIGAPSTDSAQTLSAAQKLQALKNLGAPSTDSAQTLTDAQKLKARENIAVVAPTAAKSADYLVQLSDQGRLITLSGSHTLSLDDAATLGDEFSFKLRNVGTGFWVVDPSGSQQINGKTAEIVFPGESCEIICDGTGFFSVGLSTGLVRLSSQSASNNADISFTSLPGAHCTKFVLDIDGIKPAVNGANLKLQIATGSGFITSGNRHGAFRWTATANGQAGSVSDTSMVISSASETLGTGGGVSLSVEILGANSNEVARRAFWRAGGYWASTAFVYMSGGGSVDTQAAPISDIKLSCDNGNISTGNFHLYAERA